MEIRIDFHTLERAAERGTDESEIRDVIETGFPVSARYGRIGRGKIYDFSRRWQNSYFEQKRVEVIYILEEDVIITVTVYVFYGRWD